MSRVGGPEMARETRVLEERSHQRKGPRSQDVYCGFASSSSTRDYLK
jgi:hypothetical protein